MYTRSGWCVYKEHSGYTMGFYQHQYMHCHPLSDLKTFIKIQSLNHVYIHPTKALK